MLVITRRQHESIVIGDGIEVSIVRIDKDSVRLGITAPPSIAVHRREVYEQICAENLFAAGTSSQAQRLAGRLRALADGTRSPVSGPEPRRRSVPAGRLCDGAAAPRCQSPEERSK